LTQAEVAEDFEGLLEFIRTRRGFDFTGYKRPSLQRRIAKRMESVEVEGFGAYQQYLEDNQDEFVRLFDTVMINVTSFYRDPETWEYVAREIVPKIVFDKVAVEPIRVWSTGCATGEEAYTIGMVLAEELGEEAFRDRVKIYATDVDEDALSYGRLGTYSRKQLEPVSQALRTKYFEPAESGFAFRKDLRRSFIFGRNDLVQDPPIGRIDLLIARNTLMYFKPETQGKVLSNFYFALNDSGYLLLGKSEVLLTRSSLFAPTDLKRRVFEKVPQQQIRDRLLSIARSDGASQMPLLPDERIRDAALDAGTVPQLVVAADGTIVVANGQARQLFGLGPADLDRPFSELDLSFQPVELRSLIQQSIDTGQPVTVRDLSWPSETGEGRTYDVQLAPLAAHDGGRIGTAISFTDVTQFRQLRESLDRSRNELETAYEELQSTAEELETTNEELQSTNEELETTNEELQSTNEELETMNEELQSTNEELETMNDELRSRSDDLNEVNAFLESILGSFHAAVVVVDAELRVQAWNDQASELWGLRIEEVLGQHLLNLDIGLPVAKLRDPIRASVATGTPDELVLEALNRRGRTIVCRVTISPLRGAKGDLRGAIVLMDDRGEGAR
jgi:two-component system, chemotaxis family, CheB/CheR fusion protein